MTEKTGERYYGISQFPHQLIGFGNQLCVMQ
jgi:hypothetical protein